MSLAFLPTKSWSVTPRARAQCPQTYIGVLFAMTPDIILTQYWESHARHVVRNAVLHQDDALDQEGYRRLAWPASVAPEAPMNGMDALVGSSVPWVLTYSSLAMVSLLNGSWGNSILTAYSCQ